MNKAANCALVLIALALAGAGVSYHFTLESRFSSIEQKLEQNSLALQQFQISQETLTSSKTDALDNLTKEVDVLQTSLEPLGKSNHDQTESLADIRKQIASLQQLQQAQQDSQKKLSEYASQIEKLKHDVLVQAAQTPAPVTAAPAPAPAPAPVVSAPTPAASNTALPVTGNHASVTGLPMPLPPRAESAVDLRPDDTILTTANSGSVRALPVAIPVALPETVAISNK